MTWDVPEDVLAEWGATPAMPYDLLGCECDEDPCICGRLPASPQPPSSAPSWPCQGRSSGTCRHESCRPPLASSAPERER